MGYLFFLVPVAVVFYVVWAYRKRRAGGLARSQERMAEMVGLARAPGAGVAPAVARNVPTVPVAPVVPPRAGAWAARERFLSQPETLLYYVLKAGLPGHEVFARVSLAALVQATERAGAAELERRVAGHELDFVVCDKNLRLVAAIRLDRPGQAEPLIVRQCLHAAGIKLVSIRPDALPRREQIRPLVYGEAA